MNLLTGSTCKSLLTDLSLQAESQTSDLIVSATPLRDCLVTHHHTQGSLCTEECCEESDCQSHPSVWLVSLQLLVSFKGGLL